MLKAGSKQQRIEEARKGLLAQKELAEKALEKAIADEKKAGAHCRDIRETLDDLEGQLESLRISEILNRPIPFSVEDVHTRLRHARTEAANTEITVRRQEELLKTEIPQLIEQLRSICGHRLVVAFAGHEGTQYREFEDAQVAIRQCAICHLQDCGDVWGSEEAFGVLKREDQRFIASSVPGGFQGDPRLKKDLPLREVYYLFSLSQNKLYAMYKTP